MNNKTGTGVSPYTHLKRVSLIIVLLISVGVLLKIFAVPDSFGKYGEYRGAHLHEERTKNPVHTGSKTCSLCHEKSVELLSEGGHENVPCESCHFYPYAGSVALPDAHPEKKAKPDTKQSYCLRCHKASASRPKKFPQVGDELIHIAENKENVGDALEGQNEKIELIFAVLQGNIDSFASAKSGSNEKALLGATTTMCMSCHHPHNPFQIFSEE